MPAGQAAEPPAGPAGYYAGPPGAPPRYASGPPGTPPRYAAAPQGTPPGYATGPGYGAPPGTPSGYAAGPPGYAAGRPGTQPGYAPRGAHEGTPPAGAHRGPQVGTPASRAGGGPGYSFDVRRLTLSDRIAGAATLVVLISLFLPWFSVNLAGLSTTGGVVTESGTNAHGWLWFVFVVGIIVLLYLLVAVGFQALPASLPLKHELLLLISTGFDLLLVLLAFALKPGSDGVPVKIGWGFGAVVGLVAAIVAVVPLARAALSRNGR